MYGKRYTETSVMQWSEFRSRIRHVPSGQHDRIKNAFELGQKMHADQKRKSGEPYFTHCIAVADMLADMGADADTIVAALLHDTVEDTSLTLEEIDRRFDGSVASIIDGLTKFKTGDFGHRSTMDEKIETLRKIFTLMDQDIRIMVVKLSDRLHNMQTIEYFKPAKQVSYARETLETYVKIADRLSMMDIRDEMEAICLSVTEPDVFATLSELRLENEKQSVELAKKMSVDIGSKHESLNVNIVAERKTWSKLKKLHKFGRGTTGNSDATLAFICNGEEDCYRCLGVLHGLWQREHLSFQDFINQPMINGYRGLHTTIILENGLRVRCKIRTTDGQRYAHKGIATVCFDNTQTGIRDYLKWTRHISSLSKDSQSQSDHFWNSLQSDILNESITVHGPGDIQSRIPVNSTALDAAVYCCGNLALKIDGIRINGERAHLYDQVHDGDLITFTQAAEESVSLEWLDYAHTGLSTATIREALAKQPETKKERIGQALLQKILTEQGAGFLDEVKNDAFTERLHTLGYDSTTAMFVALAEGKISPLLIYRHVFEPQDGDKSKERSEKIISFKHRIDERLDIKIKSILLKYNKWMSSLSIKPLRQAQKIRVRASMKLNRTEEKTLERELQDAGCTNIHIQESYSSIKAVIAISVLIALWGFDPVFAYKIVNGLNVGPLDITIIRFATLAFLSGIMLFSKPVFNRPLKYERISLKDSSLWVSVIFLVATAICTYFALNATTLPSHYTIPMTSAGLVLTSIVNRDRMTSIICMWGLVLIGFLSLVVLTPAWGVRGILFTTGAVISFSIFSVISEQYKRKQHIDARADQYFFFLFFFALLLCAPLLPLSGILSLSLKQLALTSLFCAMFTGLPYYIYYFTLSHKEIDFVLRYSFLIILVTTMGQAAYVAIPSIATHMAGALVICGALIPILDTLKKPRNQNASHAPA